MKLFNIEIQKGTSYELTLTFVNSVIGIPVDLTGYSSSLSVSPYSGQPAVITLSDTSANMVLGGVSGTIISYFAPADTASVDWDQAVFSLVLTDSTAEKSLLMKGFVTVVNTPFALTSNGTGGGSGSSSSTISIPSDQAYYMYNTGTSMGASDSYFSGNIIDWSV